MSDAVIAQAGAGAVAAAIPTATAAAGAAGATSEEAASASFRAALSTVLGTEEAVGAGTVGGRWRCWRRGGRRWW